MSTPPPPQPQWTVLHTPTRTVHRNSVEILLESIGNDWILLLVQAKSSESPLKPFRCKKWLDWPDFCVRWNSIGLPLDFQRTEAETSHIC
ncbi:hypothetical protein K443DRAFT_13378 [Laccaria amethystina LaAM-08-1]|uniref:Uncharacterized protein n=1 Tax=Laccaria amethystina LaAM-08-1 TaxID=1095629 RepID=A0A0C9X522_9AGAR|nr:hypothetical protein K443DRAFT_13378 [Laccaria amethystina LaAM-08-1]